MAYYNTDNAEDALLAGVLPTLYGGKLHYSSVLGLTYPQVLHRTIGRRDLELCSRYRVSAMCSGFLPHHE
jgi:hypothetical protein